MLEGGMRMADRFDGKVALVTGAAGGIGSATAERLAAEGAALVLSDIAEDGLKEVAARCEQAGASVTALAGDVAELSFLERLGTAADRVDVLVNVAGFIAGGPLDEHSAETWRRVQDVNVFSQAFLVQQALPALRRSAGASIVNVSSIAGILAFGQMPAYSASKGAVAALTRTMALDLGAEGMRVNAICPGSIDTAMPKAFLADLPRETWPEVEATFFTRQVFKRYGTPAEVAAVICFLACDDASFVTGAVIPVDGGWSCW
jgi:3alpha(or 20beta)-hydroxysteroid dehydrogenase